VIFKDQGLWDPQNTIVKGTSLTTTTTPDQITKTLLGVREMEMILRIIVVSRKRSGTFY